MKRFGLVAAGMTMILLAAATMTPAAPVTDAIGGRLDTATPAERVICSGPGCLRLLVYLQALDKVVAVDDIEHRRNRFDARPYSLANPILKTLPVFGGFRGHDNPERILTLSPGPQVIFKTYPALGHDPRKLQHKTGIPVIVLDYGDFGPGRQKLYESLRIMGRVIGKQHRAEEVIAYFETAISDLAARTRDIPPAERMRCFVGGIAMRGPHGFQSTEPNYPPFALAGALNMAAEPGSTAPSSGAVGVAKEKIVQWDPDVLFLDLATLQMGANAGGLFELETDRAYGMLGAVRRGEVYGLLPYNWYAQNFGSILANAYFVGKLLYPSRFDDVDPASKADDIYAFLVGKPVFKMMDREFKGLVYRKIPLN